MRTYANYMVRLRRRGGTNQRYRQSQPPVRSNHLVSLIISWNYYRNNLAKPIISRAERFHAVWGLPETRSRPRSQPANGYSRKENYWRRDNAPDEWRIDGSAALTTSLDLCGVFRWRAQSNAVSTARGTIDRLFFPGEARGQSRADIAARARAAWRF